MENDGYVYEILDIPHLYWESDDTVIDICTNTSSLVIERDGTMCRERIGQLSFYINDPASMNTGEPAPVLVTIRFRDSPHITYGDMQRLTCAIASRIVGQESMSSSPSHGFDDDKESVGTLDDVSVDGDDDDAGSVDDDNPNDDDRGYDSDDDNV